MISAPMQRVLLLVLPILLSSAVSASAKPLDRSGAMDKVRFMDLETSKKAGSQGAGVFSTANAGTTFFGGTYWAADSMRWEALPDSVWTFDTGVGSAIVGDLATPYPGVDQNKDPGLHAIMEGWIGFDNSFSEVTYFRRLSSADPRWGANICVGSAGGLGGSYSLWCGAFPAEANDQQSLFIQVQTGALITKAPIVRARGAIILASAFRQCEH